MSYKKVILRDTTDSAEAQQIYPRVLSTQIYKEPVDGDPSEVFEPQEKLTASDGIVIENNNISPNLTVNGHEFTYNSETQTYDIELIATSDINNLIHAVDPNNDTSVVSSEGIYNAVAKRVIYHLNLVDEGVKNVSQTLYRNAINNFLVNTVQLARNDSRTILRVYFRIDTSLVEYIYDAYNLRIAWALDENGDYGCSAISFLVGNSFTATDIETYLATLIGNDGSADFYIELLSVPFTTNQPA